MSTVCVYFVASPLQLLAARQIARTHEVGSRQVLIWYQHGVGPLVQAAEWDASSYMPRPRQDPLRGWLGVQRRLLANIEAVALIVGRCDTLHLHSAVFDSEAINYFLRALPERCGAGTMRARILPDGVISIRRYPLSRLKAALQRFRKLRRLLAPSLNYWVFDGDRIGSDAEFCDRIYVLTGWPHDYDTAKVVVLDALASRRPSDTATHTAARALVIGQPLAGAGLMSEADCGAVATEIKQWLVSHGAAQIDYKCHPKDARQELFLPGYQMLELKEPLEMWLSHTAYRFVVGVRSTALLHAKQIAGDGTEIVAFGWDRIRFKSDAERADMRAAFDGAGVRFQECQ